MIGKVEYKKHDYSGTDANDWKQYEYTNYKDWTDEASKDKNSYGNASVKKYGGFYIARYEAGWEDTETEKLKEETKYVESDWNSEKTKKDITSKKPISKANTFSWNFISQKNAKTVSENMYKNSEVGVTSYLVDGTAWDTTINWIATSNVDVTNSKSYGNYCDNDSMYTGWYAEHVWGGQKEQQSGGVTGWLYAKNFTHGSTNLNWVRLSKNNLWETKKSNYTGNENADINKNYLDTRIEIPTGSFNGSKLKNIYDLAGNMWEWTTEVDYHTRNGTDDTTEVKTEPQFAVFRGGSFHSYGTGYPLCCRDGSGSASTGMNVDIGFRVVLYVR